MLKDLWQPAYAFLVSIFSVVLAILSLRVPQGWILAVVLVAVGFAVGWAALQVGGRSMLAKPARGRQIMEWWILAPGALAAGASALVIGLTIALIVPEGTTTDVEALITSTSTAITTFIAAGFITTTTKDPDSLVAARVSAAFLDAYDKSWNQRFDGASHVRAWAVASEAPGASGWGLAARTYRAEKVQGALDEPLNL